MFTPCLRRITDADNIVAALALDNKLDARRPLASDRIRNPYKETIAVNLLQAEELVFVRLAVRQTRLAEHHGAIGAVELELVAIQVAAVCRSPNRFRMRRLCPSRRSWNASVTGGGGSLRGSRCSRARQPGVVSPQDFESWSFAFCLRQDLTGVVPRNRPRPAIVTAKCALVTDAGRIFCIKVERTELEIRQFIPMISTPRGRVLTIPDPNADKKRL